MTENAVLIILAIIGGVLSGGSTSYFLVRSNKEKNEAEATEKMVNTAMVLLEPLKKRIEELEPLVPEMEELKDFSRKQTNFIQQLLDGIRRLMEQINKKEDHPCWTPDEIDEKEWPFEKAVKS